MTISVTNARRDILFAFGVALLLAAAWFAREVLVLVYVCALLAVVITPLIRTVMRLRIGRWTPNRGAAIAIVLLAFFGVAAVFFIFALPPVVVDMRNFFGELPARVPQISQRLHEVPFLRNQNIDLHNRIQQAAAATGTAVLNALPNFAHELFRFITGAILVVYFIIEGEEVFTWLMRFVPPVHRNRTENTLMKAEQRMSKWLGGQSLLMLALGLCSLVAFYFLHLRYFYALAVLMGLFNIVPVIGAVITVSLAMLIAALDSWTKVAGVAVFYAIYVTIENAYLTPHIMKRSVDLSGAATIVALLFGAAYAGILGALVAIPTCVLIVVLLEEYAMTPGDPQRQALEAASQS